MKIKANIVLASLLVSACLFKSAFAETEKPLWVPKVQTTYYFGSRDYNSLTIQSSVDLPLSFNFWGFTDIRGNQNEPDKRFVFKRSFMEYRLRRKLDPEWVLGIKGFGVDVEYNGRNGKDTTVLRYGLTYRHSLAMLFDKTSWMRWRYLPIETFERGQQTSIAYRLGFTSHLFLTGFSDYNFDRAGKPKWVAESQLNYLVNNDLDIVLEFRYNGFEEDIPRLKGFGVAPGIKLKF